MITGICDVAHMDGAWEFDVAARAGVVAVIHKATEGRTVKDSVFAHAMRCAPMVGMLRGAYHFGRPHDVPGQVEEFLETVHAAVGDAQDVLLALDLEGSLDKPSTMSTSEAAEFVTLLRARTGRWPLLYAGASKLRQRMRVRVASPGVRGALASCPLWLAAYGPDPATYDAPEPWAAWSLLQYTDGRPDVGPDDEAAYPRTTPGFHLCDRSAWRGTVGELRAWWLSAGR